MFHAYLSLYLTLSLQDARIEKVLEFLKAPSQLSDKDLAAKVGAVVFEFSFSLCNPAPPSLCQVQFT